MRIYLFRGLMGVVFSTGMDSLSKKLETDGHEVSVHPFGSRKSVQRKCLKDFEAGLITNGVAIIGHSLGANRALRMANAIADKGVPVTYLATVDPTLRRTVNAGINADNFRSNDIRDRPIEGAKEFKRNDLNHIQIDKDDQVHQRIRNQCSTQNSLDLPDPQELAEDTTMQEYTRPGGSNHDQIENNIDTKTGDLELIDLLTQLLDQQGSMDNMDTEDATAEEFEDILAILQGNNIVETNPIVMPPIKQEEELTPVNKALGVGIGKVLNGRKTGLGIIGLLGTMILPTLFPQTAPVIGLLQALGIGPDIVQDGSANAEQIKETPNLLTPLFGALTGWGVLGKIDKWVAQIKKK